MRNVVLLTALLALLAACSGVESERPDKPRAREDQLREGRGKITGESGFQLFGPTDEDKASAASPIGVNSFLWRAALDTLSFMPFTAADPFGGTIITDWYEDPKVPGERFKVNVLILDKTLRADGVKVTLFKQKLINKVWRDQTVDEKVARSLEDTILTRARQLKIAQGR